MREKNDRPVTLDQRLRAIGAPLDLRVRAVGMSFDGIWRQSSAGEKEWLLRATDRWTSNESPADPDDIYRPAPLVEPLTSPSVVGAQTSRRRIPGDTTPIQQTPVESTEVYDVPVAEKRKSRPAPTKWPRQEREGKKEPSTWVPPHMRRKKS